ncbi:MAG: hypothetical protein ACXWUN_08170 [Allosphingosinicella sp.]
MIRRAALCLILLTPGVATPAASQIVGSRHYPPVSVSNPFLPDSRMPGPAVWQEAQFLHRRIDRARDGGLISQREARRLHRETRGIVYRARHYGRDGMSDSERAELAAQARIVSDAVALPRSPARQADVVQGSPSAAR